MQDEVAKHTKKVFQELKNPGHSIREKIIEIIIEIGIIVFAVTLSIWLHNYSEHRHEQDVANEFLLGLRKDLQEDIKSLEENRNTISNLDANYTYLLKIKKTDPENEQVSRQIHLHLLYDLTTTRLNTARYEGFKSSGKIETISNETLRENILNYYQQKYTTITDLEEFLNNWQLKVLDLDLNKDEKGSIKEFVTSDKMKGVLGLGSGNFKNSIQNYSNAIKKANEIIKEIDLETKK